MIERLTALFVERVPRAAAASPDRALRLLVVDATAGGHRVAALLERLEAVAAVKTHLVSSGAVDSLPEVGGFDLVWLLAESDDDSAFPELLRSDLAERLGLATTLIPVTPPGRPADRGQLSAADLGRCPLWRRRRALSTGAGRATALLAAHSGALA